MRPEVGALLALGVVLILVLAARGLAGRWVRASRRVAQLRSDALVAGYGPERGFAGRRNWAGAASGILLLGLVVVVVWLQRTHLTALGVCLAMALGVLFLLLIVNALRRFDQPGVSAGMAAAGLSAVIVMVIWAIVDPWAEPATVWPLTGLTVILAILIYFAQRKQRREAEGAGTLDGYPEERHSGSLFPVVPEGYDRAEVDALLARIHGLRLGSAGARITSGVIGEAHPFALVPQGYDPDAVDRHLVGLGRQFGIEPETDRFGD